MGSIPGYDISVVSNGPQMVLGTQAERVELGLVDPVSG